ncbi:MAG: DUF234 domain-containing protein [Epsilonproteobacteria bacterium]|nr:DUF234 domain-containing protein [Campylobacterota bacterium]
MELDQAIEFFSIFGGIEKYLELDFFDDLESIIRFNFIDKYKSLQTLISPSYLLDEPYRSILIAVARGDGRLSNIFRKARVGDSLGIRILEELVELDIVELEESREAPLRRYPNQKLEKSLRSYKIESKVRFKTPFYRFWFGFVEPYSHELSQKHSQRFFENFEHHFSRLSSLVFEQLSNDLLNLHYNNQLQSMGSYWDKNSEFDILAKTKSGETILGECKYKNRKICKNELSKLKQKAEHSGIKVDTFALFSKNGFSNELLSSDDKNLLLFELNDFRYLISEDSSI